MDERKPLIIDNGTYWIKAGFSNDEAPRTVFRSVIGFPKYQFPRGQFTDSVIGDEAWAKSSILLIKYPMDYGIIKNWEFMEKIWEFTFKNELHVDPIDHPVLLSEVPPPSSDDFTSSQLFEYHQKIAEIMFETFNIPSLYIANKAYLSLLSIGRTSGLSCDFGYGSLDIVPFIDGKVISPAIKRINITGNDLTSWLIKLFMKIGFNFVSPSEKDLVCDIKEKKTYVAFDYENELQKCEKDSNSVNINYKLPNDEIMIFGKERFQCPELLFKPQLNNINEDGVHKVIYDCIMKCENNFQKNLFSNIVLTGGTSMFEGLDKRLGKEVSILAPSTMKVEVIAPSKRNFATWLGGSILANMDSFPQMVITHDEYNEKGSNIIRTKL